MEEEALTTVEPIKYKECGEEARKYLLAFYLLSPTMPIPRLPPVIHNRYNKDGVTFYTKDDGKWEPVEYIALKTRVKSRPSFWVFRYDFIGGFQL